MITTNLIKRLRVNKEMTQARLAKLCGVSQATVAMWEKGICFPKAEKLSQVSRALEDMADYFAVATLDEALELKQAGIAKPVMILGYTSPSEYPELLEADVTITPRESPRNGKSSPDSASGCAKSLLPIAS